VRDVKTWRGRVFFGRELLLYAGVVAPTAPHAHPTMQLAFAPGRDLVLRDTFGRLARGDAFIVPAHARHAVAADCPRAIVLHVPMDRASTRALRGLDVAPDDARAWRAASERFTFPPLVLPRTWSEAERLARDVLACLVPGAPLAPPVHPGARRALARLAEPGGEHARLPELARAVGLSPSRLSHLFTEEVGTSLRAYKAWMRLRRAAGRLAAGAAITRAAHDAGFVDGAHMTHAFKRTFGLSPTELASDTKWFVDGAASGYKRARASRLRLP